MAARKRLDFKRKPRSGIRNKELGFGNRAYSRNTRLIEKGGTFNVRKEGQGFWESLDTYHELISIPGGVFSSSSPPSSF